ncbi:MAG: lysophospholipid acyltransferase family protein [Betaproteobacteria bacterium]|nr:lysophospholipid acyltransferase family protein [Betaproteobacteria bacterium]
MMHLVARLPLRVLHGLGGVLGWAMYALSPAYRARLRAHLAQAGYTDGATRRAAIAEAGRMVAEAPKLWLRPREEIMVLVRRVEGLEAAAAARAAGKGVLFLTPHFGCFEITAHVVAEAGRLTALYRPARNEGLERMMQAGRARGNVALAAATLGGVRQLLAALKRREAVGILPDQVPAEGEGEWAEFFGRPAYTMTLAGKLAARADVATFLVMGRRLPRGAGFEVSVTPLAAARAGESPARRVNRALEEAIRAHPAQYLWAYNRYKRPPGAPAP